MKRAEKPKYTLMQNICYLVKHVWAWDKFFLLCMGINIVSALLFALGSMFLPKAVLADLEAQVSVSTLLITILLARATFHRKQLQRLQTMESTMLLDYYQNVSMLHGSIRSLRHDLSNHLAIPEGGYRDSLLTICDQIDSQIHSQLSWQSIKTEALSSREKYEIFHYLQLILQFAKLPPEALCITEEQSSIRFTISAARRSYWEKIFGRSSSVFILLSAG